MERLIEAMGFLLSDGKNITLITGSCGVDLCINETYYNGKLLKSSEGSIN